MQPHLNSLRDRCGVGLHGIKALCSQSSQPREIETLSRFLRIGSPMSRVNRATLARSDQCTRRGALAPTRSVVKVTKAVTEGTPSSVAGGWRLCHFGRFQASSQHMNIAEFRLPTLLTTSYVNKVACQDGEDAFQHFRTVLIGDKIHAE